MNRKAFLSIVFIFFVTCLIFFKLFLRGLYPIPADLLVSFYFPWYSGSWEGYNPWTTHKEMLNADSIRQIYVWKEFAMDRFKQGKLPLWNPYTFSGQPLLANFQSSAYYPLNFVYFLADSKNSWILLIILQPLLGGIFIYLLSKTYKLGEVPSLFTAVAFVFSSYLITWMENGNIAHSYIWLPLIFLGIHKFFQKYKFRFLLLIILSLVMSILGGHPQTAIYLYMATVIYWVYKIRETKSGFAKSGLLLLFLILASLSISAVQIIPTASFYIQSPVSLPFAKEVFDRSIFPPGNLVTFFASDFFGHPASNNFWSKSYGDFTPYFGVIPLIFSFWGIFVLRKNKFIWFLTAFSVFFILASTVGPITFLIRLLRLPILDSTTPSRFMSLSIFTLVILSGFGFADFIKNFSKKTYIALFLKFLSPFTLIYMSFWIFTYLGKSLFQSNGSWIVNLSVTQRNLILPTLMFISIPAGVIAANILKQKFNFSNNLTKVFIICLFFVVTLTGGVYFSNKFMPVAPKQFIFPDHPLFKWLNQQAGINRFYGGGTAHIDFNFPLHYKVYSAEGYDTLRFERYAQLLASGFWGKVPKAYLRSDGVFANTENGYRKRLFDILGVRYLLDKEDNPKTDADWHYERFPNDKIKGIWQFEKFQIYERETVLPRIFLSQNYMVAKNDEEIINKIYDPSFDLKTLILEQDPGMEIKNSQQNILVPQIVKYDPGEIIVKTDNSENSLLFISDAYSKEWNAYIDGTKTQILRADYALTGVAVQGGSHRVVLKYEPDSAKYGLIVTSASLLALLTVSVYLLRRKKF